MPNNLRLTVPEQSRISVYRRGGAGFARLGAAKIHKGIVNLIRIDFYDAQNRPFNPRCPDEYLKDGGDPDAECFFEAILMNPRKGEGYALRVPVVMREVRQIENRQGVVDDDPTDAGNVGDICLEMEQTADLYPGMYNLVIRMERGRRKVIREDGIPPIAISEEASVEYEDLMVAGTDGSPNIPIDVTKGVLPEPYPTQILEFPNNRQTMESDVNYDGSSVMGRPIQIYVTDSVSAGGDRARTSNLHTIAIYMSEDFEGVIKVQGSLEDFSDPNDRTGWFPIELEPGREYIRYENGQHGMIEPFNFRASVRRIRLLMFPCKTSEAGNGMTATIKGAITKILIRS